MESDFTDLHRNAQKDRTEFLRTDLDLCFTFVDLAETELKTMADRDASIQVLSKAEEGHATISRLLLNVEDAPEREAIRQRLTELRGRLNSLKQQLQINNADQNNGNG